MDKLTRWGAGHELAERIVTHLVKKDFINESRFCHIYCESKLSLQKWGRIKMAYQLRAKRIDKHLIDEALKNLNNEQYHDVLLQLAQTKAATIHENDPLKHRAKLTSFLVSHGFESNEINNVLNEIKELPEN